MTTLSTTNPPPAAAAKADLIDLLSRLYARQLEQAADPQQRRYLLDHSSNAAVIRRHVDAFVSYRPFLPATPRIRILDWGCRHAADSCLIRATLGEQISLHGCDVHPPNFAAFHDFAHLQFTQLTHRWELPFADDSFDAVIASGVLEHVPNDSESLKELHRILKNGGVLIITFLPNRTSLTEFAARLLNRSHHRRRYSMGEIKSMLLHHGFQPKFSAFHQVMPTLAGGRRGWMTRAVQAAYALNPLLERIPLVRRLAANIMVVARKRQSM